MAKYYFTYGSDRHYPYPYQNGYTEVIADNIHKAVRLFNFVHPKRAGSDCANCAFYYSEEEWGAVDENVKKRLLCLEQIRTGYFAPDPETVPEEYVVVEPLVNSYVVAGYLGEKPLVDPGVLINLW